VTSEGPIKITKSTIETAWRRRMPEHRLVLRDKDCRGLALIVNPTRMSWTYAYRPRGKDPVTGRRWPSKTITLGNPASLSIDGARFEANRIKGRAAAGGDPAAERKAEAEEAQRRRGSTLGRLAELYAKTLPRRQKMRGAGKLSPGYLAAELAQIRMALADMKAEKTPAADLTPDDVRKLLDNAEGVTTARKRFGALSRFLDWCRDEEHISANPCDKISRQARPRPPQPRERYLSPEDLARLWRSAADLREPVWRDLARFLIAVPCRRNEAARMEWSHVDLEAAEWRQPGRLTKNRDPHRLYLHTLALDVLVSRLEATGGKGLVFPAPVSAKPVDTFSDIKTTLTEGATAKAEDNDAPLALIGWTWHDFRRSFATALGEARVLEVVADAILNHRQSATRGGVMGVYQRASRWDEQVAAMKLWGQLLTAALHGKPSNNVVDLQRA
jgi:integrase